MNRPDGPHEGNPAVREAVKRGEPQIVAWACERPDGGRGFGFTGGHYHRNWGNDNFRKLVLNAILWTAKVEVPAAASTGLQKTAEAEPGPQVAELSANPKAPASVSSITPPLITPSLRSILRHY